MDKNDVIVVGAGPAGMMAAISAAQNRKKVLLVEGSSNIGNKLKITGGGRCNITNARDISDFFDMVVRNDKFLYTPFYSFTNEMLMSFFEKEGVELIAETDMKVYPKSQKSQDILDSMVRVLEREGVRLLKDARVKDMEVHEKKVKSVVLESGRKYSAENIIIACGGSSYPQTGSDGKMFRIIERMGHKVNPLYPALSPLVIRNAWIKRLSGISLEAKMTILNGKKKVYSETGDILFTHFGISGPMPLCASSYINRILAENDLEISIDFVPEVEKAEMAKKIRSNPNKAIWNNLKDILPVALVKEILYQTGVEDLPNTLKKTDEEKVISAIKSCKLMCGSLMDIKNAIVTSGGVDVAEIDPHTMRSQILKNVFFAGEIIDVDALTGGYNLQIAFSTGYVAGFNA